LPVKRALVIIESDCAGPAPPLLPPRSEFSAFGAVAMRALNAEVGGYVEASKRSRDYVVYVVSVAAALDAAVAVTSEDEEP